VRGRVELESIGDLDLRGWREPIAAHRVVCAVELSEPLRSLSAPLVGRESELELLENTYERAVRDKRAALFTIYGDPGVERCRLAREFVAGLEGATVLIGRCLPYGEGVTYWPLAEMVKASSGITDDDPLDEAQRKLRACLVRRSRRRPARLAVGVLEPSKASARNRRSPGRPAPGLSSSRRRSRSSSSSKTCTGGRAAPRAARASRRVRARGAADDRRPRAAGAPRHPPDVGGGRVRATTLELEPLQAEESAVLVEALIGELELPLDIATVLAKTEGNPLFMEETVRMLAERPRGGTERHPRHAAGVDRGAQSTDCRRRRGSFAASVGDGAHLHGRRALEAHA